MPQVFKSTEVESMKDKSLSVLIKELDKLVSKYVRQSLADEWGMCKCIRCGKRDFWRYMDCAHFIPLSIITTRFYLPNLAPACKACNEIDPDWHLQMWENIVPHEQRNDLIARSKSLAKFTRSELLELIQEYKTKLKQLKS